MNFTAYIERQKAMIRERHIGEMFFTSKGETTMISRTEKLFCELSAMKGLNKKERLAAVEAR